MTDRMREEFEKEYPLPNGASLCGSHYLAPFPADGMSDYNARWESWRKAWQAARTVPDEAVVMLADVIHELENGFVRCDSCGDQEDTATLDCMDDLRRIHYMLSAAPEGK